MKNEGHFHEVSQSINLAASAARGWAETRNLNTHLVAAAGLHWEKCSKPRACIGKNAQKMFDILKKILLYRFQSLNLPGRFEDSMKEHRQLLATFREREGRKAEKIMRKHLNKKQAVALEKLAKHTEERQERP